MSSREWALLALAVGIAALVIVVLTAPGPG
jgi:hypothetical protein